MDHEQDPEAFALALGRDVCREVRPQMGSPAARERKGTAHGGDPTYAIDVTAERVVEKAFADLDDVAYFTEDEGLVRRGNPKSLFLVDPIDGTRPAAAGFETCCVSIGVAPFGKDLSLGDIAYGCLVELATEVTFEARRGKGARADRDLGPTGARELRGLFWAGGFRGQPAAVTALALQDIFDAPGSEGSYFDQGSAAYSLACVAAGRLDAFVDVGPTILEAVPETRVLWERLGGGPVLNTVTYDTAAALLVAAEAGCAISDGRGASLDEVPLFDAEGRASDVSTIAAANAELHGALVDAVARGVDRVRNVVTKQGTESFE